jgi:hypothetical protein
MSSADETDKRPGREGKSLLGAWVDKDFKKEVKLYALSSDTELQNLIPNALRYYMDKHPLEK